jgi:hypothetical protein
MHNKNYAPTKAKTANDLGWREYMLGFLTCNFYYKEERQFLRKRNSPFLLAARGLITQG